jgi:hypothetical protein
VGVPAPPAAAAADAHARRHAVARAAGGVGAVLGEADAQSAPGDLAAVESARRGRGGLNVVKLAEAVAALLARVPLDGEAVQRCFFRVCVCVWSWALARRSGGGGVVVGETRFCRERSGEGGSGGAFSFSF